MKINYPTLNKLANQLHLTEDDLQRKISFLFPENRPGTLEIQLKENGIVHKYKVVCQGIGGIKNSFGHFIEYSFEVDDKWKDYSVLVKADSFDDKRLPVFKMMDSFLTRFDSHCETQMLFDDRTCDCMQQLNLAMKIIAEHGEGAIIHIKNHEGRGKGIVSKLDQLSICESLGINTVDASMLRAELIEEIKTDGLTPTEIIDTRDFFGCVAILKFFQVPTNIKLILQTNNPYKKKALEENGYHCEFYNIQTEPNEENRPHLQAKKEQLNHNL